MSEMSDTSEQVDQPAQVPQCCGVCRWWSPIFKSPPFRVGECLFRESILHMRILINDDGKSCPCFERKEGE